MRRAALFWVAAALLALPAGCGGGKKETGGEPAPAGPSEGREAREMPLAELFARARKIEGLSYDYVFTSPAGRVTSKGWVQGQKKRVEPAN